MSKRSPSSEELARAQDAVIPDVLSPGLEVLFCGINPGLYSGATGHHFARPGNRFWPALHRSGFTERLLRPHEQELLLEHRLGITNLVTRASARASELSTEELRAGRADLHRKVREHGPRWVAVVGITAYRTAFADRAASVGPQEERLADARLWVLPNPSGLNAHWPLEPLAEEFARLRRAVRAESGTAKN